MKNRFAAVLVFGALVTGLTGLSGCSAGRAEEPEVVALPPDLRADYLVFAQRCSKCHSLARPLNSGIDSDEYWHMYVTRMRRQPASGISLADTVPILRFLHAFSLAQRRKKAESLGEPALGAPAAESPAAESPAAESPAAESPAAESPAAHGEPEPSAKAPQ